MNGSDAQRILALEAVVAELKERVAALEAKPTDAVASAVVEEARPARRQTPFQRYLAQQERPEVAGQEAGSGEA
jgi:hypothetical protein